MDRYPFTEVTHPVGKHCASSNEKQTDAWYFPWATVKSQPSSDELHCQVAHAGYRTLQVSVSAKSAGLWLSL